MAFQREFAGAVLFQNCCIKCRPVSFSLPYTAIVKGLIMGNALLSFDAPSHSSPRAVVEYEDLLRNAITHQLRNLCFESLGAADVHLTAANMPRISGAILFTLKPRLLRLLIADARASIVLALQRHLGNEQYRRRLTAEPHYRALRLHLSTSFRELMVPPSNWKGYRFSESRKPDLILAYQYEIERLELELLMMPKKIDPYVQSRMHHQTAAIVNDKY
jgi:hypothetical protein